MNKTCHKLCDSLNHLRKLSDWNFFLTTLSSSEKYNLKKGFNDRLLSILTLDIK